MFYFAIRMQLKQAWPQHSAYPAHFLYWACIACSSQSPWVVVAGYLASGDMAVLQSGDCL